MHVGFLAIESPFETGLGGGIAAYLRTLIPGLVQAGHRVTVIANSRTKRIERYYDDAVQVVPVRLPGFHWYLGKIPVLSRTVVHPVRQMEWSAQFYGTARRVFRDDPVDVLETSETGALLLALRPIAPLIVRLHGSSYTFDKYSGCSLSASVRWNRRLEVAALRRAHAITSPSRFQAMEAARDMGVTADRIHVVPNPISPELLSASQRSAVSVDDNMTVLYTGRLAAVKGIVPLLEAAKRVRMELPEARFLLAGPWQMPEGAASFGLGTNGASNGSGISWLGHVPWHQLAELYHAAAVFVMPSYFESFGISVVEAMAFGLPVVATTGGGLPEIAEDGVTGVLVRPGDFQALSEAVVGLLRDRERCRRMGQAGRRKALAQFTPERVLSETLDIYFSVARGTWAGK